MMKLGDYTEGYGAELICPACDGTHMHHERVEVFEREEDAVVGLHVTVADMQVTTDMSLEGNPSRRRDGLAIRFWCEECGGKSLLTISQHKGNTYCDFVALEVNDI